MLDPLKEMSLISHLIQIDRLGLQRPCKLFSIYFLSH